MASDLIKNNIPNPDNESDAWQLRKSVLDSNQHMLENQIKCDVKFTFHSEKGDSKGESLSCHMYMLISRSPVFYAMLAGPACEESATINIPDIERDTFQEMIRFMYIEKATINGDNVLGLLYAARKYMLPELEDKCREFLNEELDPTNVCPVLDQACNMGDDAFINKCLEVIDKNPLSTFTSEGFVNLDVESLKKILPRDTLDTNEINIWRACCNWAQKESVRQYNNGSDENKRKVLGDLLYQIRFPTMTLKDFVEEVANCDILNDKEVRTLLIYLNGGKPKSLMLFRDQARGDLMETVRFYVESAEKVNINLPEGVCCKMTINELEDDLDALEISEIHFSNPADFPFDVVKVGDVKADEIVKIIDEEFQGFPVYKAVFRKPIHLLSKLSTTIYLKTSTYSGTAPSVRFKYGTSIAKYIGDCKQYININTKLCSLTMEHDRNYATSKGKTGLEKELAKIEDKQSWHFFVGFKGRIVKRKS